MTQYSFGSSNRRGRKVEQKLLNRILKVVCDKQASYPGEIAARVDAGEEKVGSILHDLVKQDVLERLFPSMKGNDQRLLNRRRSVNGGKDAMNQRDWYALNSDYDWALKDNNTGRYVDEYGNTVENPDRRESLADMAARRI